MSQSLPEMGDIAAVILDAIPSPIFVVDDDVRIMGYNLAAARMLDQQEPVLRRRAGEVLHCLHASESPEGCGRAASCADCLVRTSVRAAAQGSRVVRKKAMMELAGEGGAAPYYLLVTTCPFTYLDQPLVLLILEDISELMELKSILPICANCKKIRDDHEYWQSVEHYFKEHLDLDFTHGLCPECARKLYPDFFK